MGSIAGPEPFDHTASVPTESSVPLESDTDWLLQQRLANNVPGKVDILKIDCNPFQPRLDFVEAELDALAQNLETHGMLQPIVVRKMDDANNAANMAGKGTEGGGQGINAPSTGGGNKSGGNSTATGNSAGNTSDAFDGSGSISGANPSEPPLLPDVQTGS